jgi:hypothetical protein
MATEQGFNSEAVQRAIDTAKAHQDLHANLLAAGEPSLADSGELSVRAECVSVTVQGGKICLNLPLGIGHYCFPIPSIFPDGTAAQACLDICTRFGIPAGVKVTVSIAGHVVFSKSFGLC